jgi:hypothetical protein
VAGAGEACDGPDLQGGSCEALGFFGGTLACTASCDLSIAGCIPWCGNGQINPGEACDGVNLGGASCQSLGLQPGSLGCGPGCQYDLSGCTGCGNGTREATEMCDGQDFGSLGCAGSLYCTSGCLVDTSGCSLLGVGTGADGPLDVGAAIGLGPPLLVAYPVVALSGGVVTLEATTAGIAAGDEVLLVNLQGSVDATESCQATGAYELQLVESADATRVTLRAPVRGVYGRYGANDDLTGQRVVLQRVPQLQSLHVLPGGVLSAPGWDGAVGGVLALRVRTQLWVEAGGRIDMTGAGFGGGPGHPDANRLHGVPGESYCGALTAPDPIPNLGGGGGGKYTDAQDDCGQGGGGGGYQAPGGWLPYTQTCQDHGNTAPAQNGGGTYGGSQVTQVFLGSGGGGGATDDHSRTSGTGGAGGGIVMLFASHLRVEGTIAAGGAAGRVPSDRSDSGNGGGGSGGTVFLTAGNLEGSGSIAAAGGSGGTSGDQWNSPGGAGSSGRIRIDFRTAGAELYGSPAAAEILAAMCLGETVFTSLLLY